MKKVISILVLTAVLVSCGTSNNVVQDGIFQKRKYTSGWFVKKNKGIDKKSVEKESVAFKTAEKDNQADQQKVKNQITSTKIASSAVDNRIERTNSGLTEKKTKESFNAEKAEKNNQLKVTKRTKKTAQSQDKSAIAVNTFSREKNDSTLSTKTNDNSSDGSSEAALILLVILCFLVPPLAVWLASRDTTQLLISIILTLLFFLPGVIHALLVVFGVI